MWEELEKIKGKVITDTSHGLQDGLRGIVPTIGEKGSFYSARDKIKRKKDLTMQDRVALARNLVHTPTSYNERLYILELMEIHKEN